MYNYPDKYNIKILEVPSDYYSDTYPFRYKEGSYEQRRVLFNDFKDRTQKYDFYPSIKWEDLIVFIASEKRNKIQEFLRKVKGKSIYGTNRDYQSL